MNNTALLELVQRDRMELMMRAPFYARIICSSELVFVRDPQVRIACTDYRRIYLSADSYPELPEEQRLAVLAHEVLHIVLRHAFRIGNRDRDRFGMAADIEIHFLLRDIFREPYPVDCDEDWSGLTAEQIYDLLPEDTEPPESDHCYPGDMQKNPQGSDQKPESEASPEEESDQPARQSAARSKTKSAEDKSRTETGNEPQEEISGFHPRFDSESEMDCRTLSEETLMDLKQQKGRGNAPAGIELLLEKLAKPHLNWRVLLRQFIRFCRGGSYCWLPPNRRFVAKGIYLPGRRDRCFQGVVALDTSGSTIELLAGFVAELASLLRSFGKFELTIIECDAEIQQVWKISSYEQLPDLAAHKFKGGGGTDFTPVFEYVRKTIPNPNVLIFFTDGDGTCPKTKPPYPVLWLLSEDGDTPVDWGQKICFEEA